MDDPAFAYNDRTVAPVHSDAGDLVTFGIPCSTMTVPAQGHVRQINSSKRTLLAHGPGRIGIEEDVEKLWRKLIIVVDMLALATASQIKFVYMSNQHSIEKVKVLARNCCNLHKAFTKHSNLTWKNELVLQVCLKYCSACNT